MEKWSRLDLKLETGHSLHLNKDYLDTYKRNLLEFLDDQDYMQSLKFAKEVMISQEIKSNNAIEGINNDLTIIDEVIDKRTVPLSRDERQRIINLFHGYQYILTHKQIDKEHLKELYAILSRDILDDYSKEHTGEYYRTAPVYIKKRDFLSVEPYEGVESSRIDYCMNTLFDYINDNSKKEEGIEAFIKSQIMHFYFVYIHPYMDVNGRTSRTMSMWYLLNKESYPYIIFNRAIAFAQSDYETFIIKARQYGDVTLFLKYMLENVQKELEKEYVVNSIASNIPGGLTKEEHQMIEYFLQTNSSLTAKDLSVVYNTYNEKRKVPIIVEEKIMPLVDKGVLEISGYTKSFIANNQHNMKLRMNPKIVKVNREKIKYLKLDRFIE